MLQRYFSFTSCRKCDYEFFNDTSSPPYPPLPFSLSGYSDPDKKFPGRLYVSTWYSFMHGDFWPEKYVFSNDFLDSPFYHKLPPGHIAANECLFDYVRFSFGSPDSLDIHAAMQAYLDFHNGSLGLPSNPAHKAAELYFTGVTSLLESVEDYHKQNKNVRKLFRKSLKEAKHSLHPQHLLLFESQRALIAAHKADNETDWEEAVADCEAFLKLSLKTFGLTCVPIVNEAFGLYAECLFRSGIPGSLERSEAILIFLLHFQEKELKKDIVDGDTVGLLAEIYQKNGRSEEGKKLLQSFPESIQLALRLAEFRNIRFL